MHIMLHIGNGTVDGDEPVDVASQREVPTAIRSLSGLSNVWLFIQTFFFQMAKWQLNDTWKKRFQMI